jgi:hypothetical protein
LARVWRARRYNRAKTAESESRPAASDTTERRDRSGRLVAYGHPLSSFNATPSRQISTRKPAGYKPELFYFFAQAWFDRALTTRTTEQSIQATRDWWGRDDWKDLVGMGHFERALLLAARFQESLGYRYATPWPIRSDRNGGRVMFYMVHATDHDRAPALMRRAYEWAVAPVVNPDDEEQLCMELGTLEY